MKIGRLPWLTIYQCPEVHGFIIRRALLPASKQNANPLEGQRPDGSVMAFVLRALRWVVLPRPVRKSDRMRGPFVKRLPEKFRASPTPMHPILSPTAFDQGSDTAAALDLGGAAIAISQCAHGRDQPRR